MHSLNKFMVTTLVFGTVLSGFINVGQAADIDAKDVKLSSGWDVESVFNQTFLQIQDLYDTRANQSTEIHDLKMSNLSRDSAITHADNKSSAALSGVAKNGTSIIALDKKADQIESEALLSGLKADDAKTRAITAQGKADFVEVKADHAQATADTATTTANNADAKADANAQLISNNALNIGKNQKALSSKVDTTAFQTDQARQDKAVENVQTQAARNSTQLTHHESRITNLENQNNARFSSVEHQQNEDRKEYRAGIAGVGAIAGLHYVDTDNAVAVGAANFKDAQGYAMGYRHKFSENVAATMSTSGTSNGDEIVAASASFGW